MSVKGKISVGDESFKIRNYILDSWSISHTRFDGEQWLEPTEQSGDSQDQFWQTVGKLCTRKHHPWIVSTQCEQDFTLLGGWNAIENRTIDFGSVQPVKPDGEYVERKKGNLDRCSLVLGQAVTILCHHIGKGMLTWIGSGNYSDASIVGIAESLGLNAPVESSPETGSGRFPYNPSSCAPLVRLWLARMIDSWRKNKRGPWRTTAAQLGHSHWRKSHYTHGVLEHGNVVTDEIERAAMYGGRASVWYSGDIGKPNREPGDERTFPPPASNRLSPGKAIHIDVRSMYPWLLREREFPVRWERTREDVPIEELREAMETRAVIARVKVRTEKSDYPFHWQPNDANRRHKGNLSEFQSDAEGGFRTIYPVGHWIGCYAGPELASMLDRGEIEEVQTLCEYERKPAFQSFATSILNDRMTARRSGDRLTEMTCKLIANAFAGKFASRGGGWCADPDTMPDEMWGQWSSVDRDAKTVERFRAFGGIVQRYRERTQGPVGVPSIFAYLTSYGRIFMNGIRDCLPSSEVYHQDTDGMWVHPDVADRLVERGYCFGDEPGQLRIDYESNYLRFLTPKHYCVDGEWVLSGIALDSQPMIDMQWIDTVLMKPSQTILDGPVSTVQHADRTVDLSFLTLDGQIKASGWIGPLRMPPVRDLAEHRSQDGYVHGLPPEPLRLF